jgi:pyrimidine-nucleoside phosphorylase
VTPRDHRSIVAAKRDGKTLAPDEVRSFIEGYTAGEVTDPLAAAFLMACCTRGLDPNETLALTRAMVDSGETVDFTGMAAPTVDKHSTGGVADGVTLVFAPLAAALGLAVAKLSGRGLGHTGGTLDKLESIPGLGTALGPAELRAQVEEIGCAVAAQSPDLVPADGKLYALRDATATVESIPLIAASVMSKKLAVGTDLIVLDVKAGSGAFMKTPAARIELAGACLALARGWGRRCIARVTDMSQPLGDAVGNALDVAEAVAVLRGERGGRLRDLTVRLAADALTRLEGVGADEAAGKAVGALEDGGALERFRRMVAAQGGDPHVVDDPMGVLPRAPIVVPIEAGAAGTLAAVDAEAIGRAAAALGAGRHTKDDPIDPAVGIVCSPKIGDRLDTGQQIGAVHARTDEDARAAAHAVLEAFTLTEGPVPPPPLVYAEMGEGSG